MKWLRRAVICFGLGVLAVVLIDWGYSRWVGYRYRQWEATIERDASGVRADFQAISAGEGDHAVLLVHGFASSPKIFYRYIDYFSRHDVHVRAVRLPGFGDVLEVAREVRAEDWINAVVRESRALREKHDSVWIISHSLGGAVSLAALQGEPDLVDGLILLAPLFDVSRVRSPLVEPRSLFRFGQRLRLTTDLLESILPVDARDPALREWENDFRDRFIPLSIYEALFEVAEKARATRLSKDFPVALVLSTSDEIIDPHSAKAWLERQSLQRQRVIWVKSSGHLLMVDTGWEATLLTVVEFMREVGLPIR